MIYIQYFCQDVISQSVLKFVGLYPEIPGGTELDFSALKEEVKLYVTNQS